MTRRVGGLTAGIHAPGSLRGAVLDGLAGATAALVTGVATVSFASLVFSGRLAPFVADGTRLALLAGLLLPLFGLRACRDPRLVLIPNPVAPLVAAVVAAGVATLPADAPAAAVYATGFATLAASTLITGGFMYALGRLDLVAVSRRLPYPLLVGLFGAVGWMFLAGTPRAMGLAVAGPGDLLALGATPRAMLLLALGLGVALVTLPGRVPPRLRSGVVPALLVLFFAGFHGWRIAGGLSLEALARTGALLALPDGGSPVPLPSAAALAGVDWRAVLAAPTELAALAALTALKATLMLGAIEVQTRQRFSPRREMSRAGLGSLLVAPLGGYPGHVSISMSMIIDSLGGRTARASWALVAVAGAAWIGGSTVMTWLPVPMIGGVLVYVGVSMLASALVHERRRMARPEFAVVVAVVVAQVAFGFVPAVLTGFLAAVALFVVDFGRQPVAHLVERAGEGAEPVCDLALRGHLFFGNAEAVITAVEGALRTSPTPRSVRLDLAGVTGLDVSAAACFEKIATLADEADALVVLTGLSPAVARPLARIGVLDHPRVEVRAAADQRPVTSR